VPIKTFDWWKDDWQDTKPSGWWKHLDHQRSFLDHLAVKLNIQKPQDWYKVHSGRVVKEGGSFISKYYDGSLKKGMTSS
jgi:hypothetical protein